MTPDTADLQGAISRPNQRPLTDYALIGDMRGTALRADDATMDRLSISIMGQ